MFDSKWSKPPKILLMATFPLIIKIADDPPSVARFPQDHRFIKRLVKPGMGFFSFQTAWRTLQGYELMHMIRKGQVQKVGRGDSPSQAAFIAELFGIGT